MAKSYEEMVNAYNEWAQAETKKEKQERERKEQHLQRMETLSDKCMKAAVILCVSSFGLSYFFPIAGVILGPASALIAAIGYVYHTKSFT